MPPALRAAQAGQPITSMALAAVSMPSATISGAPSRASPRRIAAPPTGPSDRRGSRNAAFASPSVCNHVRWIATGPCSTCSTSAIITGRRPPSGWRSQDRAARIVGGIGSSARPRAAQYHSTAVPHGSPVSCRHKSSASAIRLCRLRSSAARRRSISAASGAATAPSGITIEQPEPAQLGEHVITRATGMAMRDQPARSIAQCQGRAAGLMHRTAAAAPCPRAAGPAKRGGNFCRVHAASASLVERKLGSAAR